MIGKLTGRLDAIFPAQHRELNVALANVLIYLQSPLAAGKIVPLLQQAPTQEEQIDYALALRTLTVGWTPELREKYFRWFVSTAAAYRGGPTAKRNLSAPCTASAARRCASGVSVVT